MQALAVTAFRQLVVVVSATLDQDAAASQVTPDRDALAEEANLDLVDLVFPQEVPGLDVRRSDDRSQDLLAGVAQTLGPLVEKAQLVARFPVGERWGELLTLAVLVALDQDVLADREDLDQDAQAAKEDLDQDDDQDGQGNQPQEERCNTR